MNGRTKRTPCKRCEHALNFDFTMAFQPIVDLSAGRPISYEALVRGINGESAGVILDKVDEHNLHAFDQACRIRAIELAHDLELDGSLSINFLPNAVYTPQACIEATLQRAREVGWPRDQLSFEIVETEYVQDRPHLQNIVTEYRDMGFRVGLDDFGSGYANLELLTDLWPNYLKIDRCLIDGVANNQRRAAIVKSIAEMCQRLELGTVAEGVETLSDARWLYHHGITVQQGFFYARPAVEAIPALDQDQLADVVHTESVTDADVL